MGVDVFFKVISLGSFVDALQLLILNDRIFGRIGLFLEKGIIDCLLNLFLLMSFNFLICC